MQSLIAGRRVRLAADIDGVRDITLSGSAEAGFWTCLLEPEGLAPLLVDGRARLQLLAVDARFKGLPFRELSLAVQLSPGGEQQAARAAWLCHAFNSRAAFAWVERTLFHTPYRAGRIAFQTQPLPAFGLDFGQGPLLQAAMGSPAGSRIDGQSDWEGPLFLPTPPNGQGRCFLARLTGEAITRPYGGEDSFVLGSSAREPGLKLLAESDFRPETWSLRQDARHMKSHTLKRQSIIQA